MAVFGGVNFMSPRKTPEDFVLRVAIAGGITTGPALTNQTWVFTEIIQGISFEDGDLPEKYSLLQNFPNPFNPSTTINFSIPEASLVSLKVFNSLGQEIETLVSKELNAGNYKYDWDAKNFSSGIYFYKMQAGDFIVTKKMILLK
jgi:hypothetical protein